MFVVFVVCSGLFLIGACFCHSSNASSSSSGASKYRSNQLLLSILHYSLFLFLSIVLGIGKCTNAVPFFGFSKHRFSKLIAFVVCTGLKL
uniref:Putative secreted peptide n=1 Tax=Anopheles braziliensis TaxID=58242 RepID=A0A2M3ZU33_9DIPT